MTGSEGGGETPRPLVNGGALPLVESFTRLGHKLRSVVKGWLEVVGFDVSDDRHGSIPHEHGGVASIAERDKPSHKPDAGRAFALNYMRGLLGGSLAYRPQEAVHRQACVFPLKPAAGHFRKAFGFVHCDVLLCCHGVKISTYTSTITSTNSASSRKSLVEMYMFYENIENLNITSRDKAKLYVESIEPILIDKMKSLKKEMKEFGKSLKDVVVENTSVYNDLDILSEESNMHNIASKIDARENLINHLISEKKKEVVEPSPIQIENHSLLNAVLVNNFNIKYADFLNEEQKGTFNKIVSMTNDDLVLEMNTIKKELNNKLDSLLKESTEDSVVSKLNNVKSEVDKSEVTKYNYYKLIELKNGLI